MAFIRDIYSEEMGVLVQHNTFEKSFNLVFSITSCKLQLQIIPEGGFQLILVVLEQALYTVSTEAVGLEYILKKLQKCPFSLNGVLLTKTM